MDETPLLRQLLICEKLIFEQGTGNVSLINCHNIRLADRFPIDRAQFAVYGLLTNGSGAFTMTLTITRLETGEAVYRKLFPMLSVDRLRDMNMACRIDDWVIAREGSYQIDLETNGIVLGMTTLHCRKR